ncbi:hypothetical protein [Streptosporangium sp. CA-115845]|uniref:hypothetical protein n=1 Tax=Streptosporangium sp. CA-115845 TaxID=3240071 RepID=UPI003D8B296B
MTTLADLDKVVLIDFRTGAVTVVTLCWQDVRRLVATAEDANSHDPDTTLFALASIRDARVTEVYLDAATIARITADALAAKPHPAL